MDDPDLTDLLREWPFESGRINARRIEGRDGRPKLQIRISLGLLQMEMTGRPDGRTPHGCESLLHYHSDRLSTYKASTGTDTGFVLSSAECAALREEAVQYYHRYVGLYALREFDGVILDAERNLEVIRLCRQYGESEIDRTVLEQFRPQVITIRARSAAELALEQGRPKQALAAIDRGLEELQAFYDEAGMPHAFQNANESQLLRGMRDVLVPKLPSSQRAELMERLRAAIDAENYELAAILRDELRMLG